MTLKHINLTQLAKAPTFLPLLKDESAYYNNLNRAPKNAYDYANNINNMFTYGGSVSKLKADTLDIIEVYNIVRILDSERIVQAKDTSTSLDRFGIIVMDKDEDDYYTVCTFNPNFVYPASIISFNSEDVGKFIYLDETTFDINISNITTTGNIILGKITGKQSIFFQGTSKLEPIPPQTLSLTYDSPIDLNAGSSINQIIPSISGLFQVSVEGGLQDEPTYFWDVLGLFNTHGLHLDIYTGIITGTPTQNPETDLVVPIVLATTNPTRVAFFDLTLNILLT